MSPKHFHPALRILHWLIATLIISALFLGTFVMARTPNSDPSKPFILIKHMLAGLLVLALALLRMFVRPRTKRPAPVFSGIELADRIVPFVHRVFDVMVLVMAGSGIGIALLSGLPGILLGGAALPASFDDLPVHTLHVFAARSLAAILALHVCGALYHHFILRDGLLWRMWATTGKRGLARLLP